jgi:hypothetical protein
MVVTGPSTPPPSVAGSQDEGSYSADLGPVGVGMALNGTLMLTNIGVDPLQILSVSLPTDAQFGLELVVGTAIAPGSQIAAPVSFKPVSIGPKTATVVIETDSLEVPTVTLTLTGTGVN